LFDLELTHVKGYEAARFATKTDVLLPEKLRSCGIGSYAFSELIKWGAAKGPSYPVRKLRLSIVDARTDEDRDRRNNFYRKLGFTLHFDNDIDQREGYCDASALSLLKPYTIRKKSLFPASVKQ